MVTTRAFPNEVINIFHQGNESIFYPTWEQVEEGGENKITRQVEVTELRTKTERIFH